jgi:hypothetical protein
LARKYTETVTFNAGPDVVMACLADVFVHGFKAKPEQGPRGISAKTRASMSGWGESVTAIIEAVEPEGTIVTIYSESVNPLGLLDWGINKHNVQKLITQVGWRLAPGGPGGPSATS